MRAYPHAVGSRDGEATFFVYDQSWSHSLMERVDRTSVSKLEVHQVAFERVMAEAASKGDSARTVIVKVDAKTLPSRQGLRNA